MAKATSILSPKRAAERMRRHQLAVRVLALMRAKKAVQAQIRAKGQRISDYSAKEINHLAEAELECNRTRLIAEAEQVIAASPLFAISQQIRTNGEAAKINHFHFANIRCEMIVGYARVSTDGQP